jgi:hypothetical protein
MTAERVAQKRFGGHRPPLQDNEAAPSGSCAWFRTPVLQTIGSHVQNRTMKKLSLAALFALALLTPAFAKTFKVPDEDSFASITIPDDWKSKEIDKGVESQSKDDQVYFAVEASDAKGLDKTIEDAIDFLKEQGVTIDTKTQKQSEGKINGMDGVDLTWNGKDKEGDAIISLTILAVRKDKALLITYWASPEGTKSHAKELGEIISSVKGIM